MNNVGIIYYQKIRSAKQLSEQMSKYLYQKSVSNWVASLSDEQKITTQTPNTDTIFSIGGDGTILHIARLSSPWNIPIVGINLGKIGFLTEIDAADILEKLPLFLQDKAWIDERNMLQAEVIDTKGGSVPGTYINALNDIVIGRGAVPRLIRILATIDGELLSTYKADGLIISTATGSTAYSLANRGPIIYPQSKDILLIPISPYLCMSHPLVLPSSANIELQILPDYEGVLSSDGQVNINLPGNSIVKIKRSSYVTRLLRICSPHSFYSLLEQKLKGK